MSIALVAIRFAIDFRQIIPNSNQMRVLATLQHPENLLISRHGCAQQGGRISAIARALAIQAFFPNGDRPEQELVTVAIVNPTPSHESR